MISIRVSFAHLLDKGILLEESNLSPDISEQGEEPPDSTKQRTFLTTPKTIKCPSGARYDWVRYYWRSCWQDIASKNYQWGSYSQDMASRITSKVHANRILLPELRVRLMQIGYCFQITSEVDANSILLPKLPVRFMLIGYCFQNYQWDSCWRVIASKITSEIHANWKFLPKLPVRFTLTSYCFQNYQWGSC
jgi:hypothetical protein